MNEKFDDNAQGAEGSSGRLPAVRDLKWRRKCDQRAISIVDYLCAPLWYRPLPNPENHRSAHLGAGVAEFLAQLPRRRRYDGVGEGFGTRGSEILRT